MAVTTVAARPAPPDDGPTAPHPPRPGRRWPRRTLIGLNLFLAVCLVGTGVLYGYVRYRFGQIKRISIATLVGDGGKTAKQTAAAEAAGAPINILVVGSDSRAFVSGGQDALSFGPAAQTGGQRSDTTMVVHLDPRAGTASLLSIPRDLWVPIGSKGYSQRINTAFDTGPDLLIQTIQDDLHIPINHYVDVDFKTFRDVVNSLGGIKFWYPEPVHDTFSGLNITTPGCYTLTGDMALSLVRARHMTYQENGRWKVEGESDLARIRRQQLFLKRVAAKAESAGLGDITAINGVVGGIVSNITVDSGFSQKEMLKLARRYKAFNPASLVTMTLPASPAVVGGADVLLPIPTLDTQMINTFLGVPGTTTTSTAPSAASRTPVAPSGGVDTSTIVVHVLNGSGRTGEATSTARDLRTAGFLASVSGNGRADNFGYTTPVIEYGPSDLAAAQTLQADIVGGATLQANPNLANGLTLITGQSYGGVSHNPVPAATATTPTTAAAAPAPSTTLPVNESTKPAFPGIHGSDPPPPGQGC